MKIGGKARRNESHDGEDEDDSETREGGEDDAEDEDDYDDEDARTRTTRSSNHDEDGINVPRIKREKEFPARTTMEDEDADGARISTPSSTKINARNDSSRVNSSQTGHKVGPRG